MNPLERNIALVHVPSTSITNTTTWKARRVMLIRLGCVASVGLCGVVTNGSSAASPSPLPTNGQPPSTEILRALGCETAHGLPELALAMNNREDYDLAYLMGGLPYNTSLTMLTDTVDHVPTLARLFRQRLDTLLARISQISAKISDPREALFIASEHSWLLLALAYKLCAFFGRNDIAALPVDRFQSIALVHGQGCWGGFVDLSPVIPRDMYDLARYLDWRARNTAPNPQDQSHLVIPSKK